MLLLGGEQPLIALLAGRARVIRLTLVQCQ